MPPRIRVSSRRDHITESQWVPQGIDCVRGGGDRTPIVYTLTIREASGQIELLDGSTIEVFFESATVTDVLTHTHQQVLLEQRLNMLSFTLRDPKKWPDYRDNDYFHELDLADVTNDMIQRQNDESTGINPATINDDNF